LEEVGLAGFELEVKLQASYDAVEAYEERPTPTRFSDVLGAADITLGWAPTGTTLPVGVSSAARADNNNPA